MLIDVFQSPTSTELRDILKEEKIKTKVNQMVNEYLVHFMDPGDDVMDSSLTIDGLVEEMDVYKAKALGMGADPHDTLLNAGKEKMIWLWKQGKPFSAMKFVTFYGWHCNRLASMPAAALRKRPTAPPPRDAQVHKKRAFETKWTKKVSGPVNISKMPVDVGRYPIVHQHSFVPLRDECQSAPWADDEPDMEEVD